ncbi:MAG: hypothetical protein QMD77_00945 [Patescibacteria group bacterium]|nr:hypothetical protein [Patescibacteria group bacterium]
MKYPGKGKAGIRKINWKIIPTKELQYLSLGSYILLTCALFMMNESTSFLQWVLFSVILVLAAYFGIMYFYRRATEAKQWLAITLTEFCMILCGIIFFIAGALEATKIVGKQSWFTVPPPLATFAVIIIYVYLNVKNHRPKTE